VDDLDGYRDQADRFLTELMEEYYLQYAGLKERLELEPIYARHEELTSLDACEWLARQAAGARPGSGSVELWRFACEAYLGTVTREQEERIAELETTLTADLEGERVPFRTLRPRLANEPERARREAIDRARLGLVEELNPVYAEALERSRAGVQQLGAGTQLELYERFGLPLTGLGRACARFLEETEELYAASFDRLLRARIDLPLGDAGRWDVPRALRAPRWDEGFAAESMLPALERTLSDLGIDLCAQRNVHLDLARRASKSPRAFCAPIEVPGRVMLVLQPIGGLEDWRALFHEAGHMEHFAHTSARLGLEARRLGDNAVTEAWAFLLERLVTEPAWLRRRLDFGDADELGWEAGAVRLHYLRRYCAKLLSELDLHAGAELDPAAERYAELLSDATKVEYSSADFLGDVDPGFYVSSYLRAWTLEAQVSGFLREEHGSSWFADRRAGSLLRELWSEGQGLDADRIAAELTGAELSFDPVREEIESALAS
jgi:hypothetical protein